MSNPYLTRDGGATVTVFVPYDCHNHCPFCINKQEYADTSTFSLEKICQSITTLHEITPRCDFVFTGGEPLADLPSLQRMLDLLPNTHRIFINTTLPVIDNSQEQLVAFLNRNREKITCVNVSRHIQKYVVEGDDAIFDRLEIPARINCVLYGAYSPQKVQSFLARFRDRRLPIQFRYDYTNTTPENLYDEDGDEVFQMLSSLLPCTGAAGCRMRCNYDFGDGKVRVSYHKTLPYSTIPVVRQGVRYDLLYDVIIKQTGEIHSDWTGVVMDVDAYRHVRFEPYDLRSFTPGHGQFLLSEEQAS